MSRLGEFLKSRKLWIMGPAIGILNGFFGAGGGMVAVPLLRGLGLEQEKCHATSMAVILPLAALSGLLYLQGGYFVWTEALVYMPGGLLGALAGAWLLPRIKTWLLRKIFALVILFSAVRLMMR